MKKLSLESIQSYFLNAVPHRLFYYGEIKEHAVFLPYFEKQPLEYAINGHQLDPYPLHTRRQIANGRYPLLLVRYHFQFKEDKTYQETHKVANELKEHSMERMYWFACITPEELLVSVTTLQATFEKQKCTVVKAKRKNILEYYLSAKKNDWLWQLVYAVEPLPGEHANA